MDLIDRQDAIDALDCNFTITGEENAETVYQIVKGFCDKIKALPSVERKKGKWIMKEKIYPDLPNDSDYRFECSLCGWSDQHNDKMIVPYCWHCGAEMENSNEIDR